MAETSLQKRPILKKTAAKIDLEIKKIIDEAHALATSILTEHFDKLQFVADFLVKYEEMDDEQFRKAMEEENPTLEGIYALAEERRRISEKENEEKARIDEEERKKREEELMQDADYREGMRDVNAEGEHSDGNRGQQRQRGQRRQRWG